MAEREKIGILFRTDYSWTGGVYYIMNFLNALGTVPYQDQPDILVFTDNPKDFTYLKSITSYKKLKNYLLPPYPYKGWHKWNAKLYGRITGKNEYGFLRKKIPDILFPYSHHPYIEMAVNKIYWIPDFQDKHLPGFFSESVVAARDTTYRSIAASGCHVVFSSFDALNDYLRFYPGLTTQNHVLQFAVTPPQKITSAENLQQKYELDRPFFYAPNQFWKHKNHQVIIEAVRLLKEQSEDVLVLFSGREHDPRNPEYVSDLKKMVRQYDLENNIRFLGFIEREDVYGLIRHSVAVIQPSLFEGWSTVVEDTKSLNSFLILSDLNVHREQNPVNAAYFDPHSPAGLFEILFQISRYGTEKQTIDYNLNIKKYGEDILHLFDLITKK